MRQVKTSEVLLQAKKLVEKGWCQGSPAREADGSAVFSKETTAVKWCAIGALYRALDYLKVGMPDTRPSIDYFGMPDTRPSRDYCGKVLGIDANMVLGWNDADGRTQSEVIEMFEKAYQLALKDEETVAE